MRPMVLVVDDEPLVRLDLIDLVEEAGFDTVQAANSQGALKILEDRDDVRVVFTDIRMPGDMDGLAFAHLVRDRWPPTYIVICSGNAEPLQSELPKNAIFLSKPCNGPKLKALLSTILEEVS